MAEFVAVASLDQVPPGSLFTCEVGGEEIVICNCEGTLYAINNVCSHAYAQLSKGELDEDDCTLECPLHGAIFDVRSGRPRTLPATAPVASYPVEVVEGVVHVAV